MSYLHHQFPLDDPAHVRLWDEVSLWASQFGHVLLENMPLRRGMSVLDVGFGLGFPLFEIAHRLGVTAQVTGIDPWEAAVGIARQKAGLLGLRNVKLELGDASKMPFEDKSFDLVVSNLGINNFDDPPAVLAECHRVLKRPGRLCMTTNLQGHFAEFYDAYRLTLKELGMAALLPALEKEEQHRATDESIRDLLEGARFSVSKVLRGKFCYRFANGTALLNHPLCRVGFLPSWRGILPPEQEALVFSHLEKKLNKQADWDDELKMTVPTLYVEAVK